MEEKNIEELLNEEIAAQIEALSGLQSGTKEKSSSKRLDRHGSAIFRQQSAEPQLYFVYLERMC